jgi:rhamnulokinase
MTDTPVHLAVDLGASSGRVIAGRIEDGTLKLDEVHRFANEPVMIQNSLQWNVHGLWAEILEGLRIAASRFSGIRSVGVDTWGVDYVLLDENDQIAAPIRHYRDARSNGMLARAFDKLGGPESGRQRMFEATGLQFMEINTVFQLLSAVENRERSLEIADGFLMMGDFFHWLLSGKRSIEASNASTSQMLDPKTGRWQMEMIRDLGIPTGLFVPVTRAATTLGNVQPSVAAATGLHDVPVVLPATHDTASAVIAVPADAFAPEKPDWCYISSGTWSLMGCELASPRVTDLCAELNFTNEGGVGGSTRLLKNIGGLWIFQQIRKSMQRRGKDVTWQSMVESAESSAPFELLIDPDHADFIAPIDMIDAMEAFAAKTGQAAAASEHTYYRASLEGLALRYRVCLELLEQLVDNRIETIHIVGGGTMNELLCQMTADACNRPVFAGPVEATAIGNLVMQMVGTGEIGSGKAADQAAAVLEARKLVRESFAVKTYTPNAPQQWDEPASRFVALGNQ